MASEAVLDTKELNEKLETVYKGIKTVQDDITNLKEKGKAYDPEKLEKAANDAANALQAIQESKASQKYDELKARMDDVEAELAEKNSHEGKDLDEYKNALGVYLRKGSAIDSDLEMKTATQILRKTLYGVTETDIEREAKDLLAASGPDGGYTVMADRSNSMVERIFETSPLRGVANVETTTSDVFEMLLDDDEADVGVVGEVSARPDTGTPQIGVIKIPLHEYYAQPKATQKILDDAGFDVESWLNRKVADRIGRRENTDFVTNSGNLGARGFLTYPNWTGAEQYTRNAVERITSSTSGDFTADDLIALQNSLLEEYQGNATWGMRRATFTKVMQFKGSDGQYLLNPQILMQGATKMLLGSDVVFMNDIPLTAANALPVVIADWSEFYTIVDRMDIRVLRDPYTLKPFVRFYTTKRTGGAVTNYQAGKILQIAA